MKLEIEFIDVEDIQPGEKSGLTDRVLRVDTEELKSILLEDAKLKDVEINFVYPGEATRIVNLYDVVQPRCKIDRVNADFPGFVGKMQTAGHGRTRALRGITVLVSNPETERKYSAFLDMAGNTASKSRYGSMKHLHIAPHKAEGVLDRTFEDAVKIAGFKASVYLARAAEGNAVDETKVYDLDIPSLAGRDDLPRVGYYYQLYSPQHDHVGISDSCFYGSDVRTYMPTIIHPNEVLDGGVVGHHTIRALDTYSIQNHAIINELYKRHNKDLIFCGVVCGVANMDPVVRTRKAMMASSLMKNALGADAAVLTKIHGGLPHVDLGLVGEEMEKIGIKTAVFISPLISSGTLPDMLLFNAESLDLIITVAATLERVIVEMKPERILGGTEKTKIYCPDPVAQYAADDRIDTEQFIFAGIHDHVGGRSVTCVEY